MKSLIEFYNPENRLAIYEQALEEFENGRRLGMCGFYEDRLSSYEEVIESSDDITYYREFHLKYFPEYIYFGEGTHPFFWYLDPDERIEALKKSISFLKMFIDKKDRDTVASNSFKLNRSKKSRNILYQNALRDFFFSDKKDRDTQRGICMYLSGNLDEELILTDNPYDIESFWKKYLPELLGTLKTEIKTLRMKDYRFKPYQRYFWLMSGYVETCDKRERGFKWKVVE